MPVQSVIFKGILALALAYGFARAASAGGGMSLALRAVGAGLLITVLSFMLHAGAGFLLAGAPVAQTPPLLLAFVGFVFTALFFFQALLWRAGHYPLGRRLYVHALNGFYLGTLANRMLGKLWPSHPIS